MVCRLADRVWTGDWICGQSAGEGADTPIPVAAVFCSCGTAHLGRRRGQGTMRVAAMRLNVMSGMVVAVAGLLAGCSRIPGRPGPGPEVVRPDEVLNFATLYKTNCAACHGENGKNGAAISLANPAYLAVAGEDNLQQIAASGVPGK